MKAHPTEDEHKNQEQVSCPGSDDATPQSEASQSRRGDDDFEDRMQTALILEDHAGARDWLSAVVNDAFPGINVLLAPNLTEARAKLGHLNWRAGCAASWPANHRCHHPLHNACCHDLHSRKPPIGQISPRARRKSWD